MSKIKHTKNELKAQRDALRRFERYLPTLQLKKQQLQIEIRQVENRLEERRGEIARVMEEAGRWIRLLAEPVDLRHYLRVTEIRVGAGNIAGVPLPLFQGVSFERVEPDLHATPAWLDDALELVEKLVLLRAEAGLLAEQHRRLSDELRTTSQRVNLFEKVKIPESEHNIRVIRIFLGDAQTAEVARAKLAKGKSMAREEAA